MLMAPLSAPSSVTWVHADGMPRYLLIITYFTTLFTSLRHSMSLPSRSTDSILQHKHYPYTALPPFSPYLPEFSRPSLKYSISTFPRLLTFFTAAAATAPYVITKAS